MKIYSTEPDGNQMADLEPARYFNLAINQIAEIERWLQTTEDACQPLLAHIDVFIYLSKKYPEMARRRVAKLDRPKIKETFFSWFDRVEKKIPVKFREGIKESANQLFSDLDKI